MEAYRFGPIEESWEECRDRAGEFPVPGTPIEEAWEEEECRARAGKLAAPLPLRPAAGAGGHHHEEPPPRRARWLELLRYIWMYARGFAHGVGRVLFLLRRQSTAAAGVVFATQCLEEEEEDDWESESLLWWTSDGDSFPVRMDIPKVDKRLEQMWYDNNMILAWMDYPDEYSSEEGDCEEVEVEMEEDGDRKKGEEWSKYCEEGLWKTDPYETTMRKQMCIAWILARKMMMEILPERSMPKIMNPRERMMLEFEDKEVRECIMRVWRESAHKDLRAQWKDSEMERMLEISSVILMNKYMDLEQTYVMKQQLNEAQEKGLQLDMQLKNSTKNYIEFRKTWVKIHSCWDGVFEDITKIRAMAYTRALAPKYVYKYGPPDTLQIFSVKVGWSLGGGSDDTLRWPLHVFGLIALRDSIDQHRNVIFNRTRDDCQIVTEKDPYLVLTGPTRAVVINEETIPVTVEAELKVKSPDGEKNFIFVVDVELVPTGFRSGWLDLTHGNREIKIALGRVMTSVEATIFARVIEGAWPTGFNGQLAARTSNNHKIVVLAEFGGDGPVTDNGNVDQFRFVVSVESYGELVVFSKAWRDDETMQGEVTFNAERKGRGLGNLMIGSCKMEILVAWSPIRPVCEELVSWSDMDDMSDMDDAE